MPVPGATDVTRKRVATPAAADYLIGVQDEEVVRLPAAGLTLPATPETYGAAGDGVTDDTAAIQAAVNALHAAGGGVLLFRPAGRYAHAGLDFTSKAKITLTTGSSREGIASHTPEPATLLYTPSGSGVGIKLSSAQAITFRGLGLRYSSTTYTGDFIDFQSAINTADAAYIRFDGCAIGGTLPTACNARSLMRLDHGIISSINNCSFEWGAIAIRGVEEWYAYAWEVRNCTFRALTTCSVYNMGGGWVVSGCTFEPNAGNRATFFDDDGAGTGKGIVIQGCWLGDVNAGTDYAIRGKFYGLSVIGNYCGINSAGAGFVSLKTASEGVLIASNRVEATNGVRAEGAYAYGVTIAGNSWQVTSRIVNPANFARGFLCGDGSEDNESFGTASGLTVRDGGTFTPDLTRDVLGLGHMTTLPGNTSLGVYLGRVSSATGFPQNSAVLLSPADFAVLVGSGASRVIAFRAAAAGVGPASSAWDGPHAVQGAYHEWYDAEGRKRCKNGAPTSDHDGAVVGTQS